MVWQGGGIKDRHGDDAREARIGIGRTGEPGQDEKLANIRRYREEIKRVFPSRFPPAGENVLYKAGRRDALYGQLALGFEEVPPEPVPRPPLPNTADNFDANFAAIAGEFKKDDIEAARFLLRGMAGDERSAALERMRLARCADRESHHRHLRAALAAAGEARPDRKRIRPRTRFQDWRGWTRNRPAAEFLAGIPAGSWHIRVGDELRENTPPRLCFLSFSRTFACRFRSQMVYCDG